MTHTHPDPAFPALHGRPARGWLNDPNGCALVEGRYHVFFQANPEAPVHHRIAWGHLSSVDLVHWREEPIALAPRDGKPDAFGCWTGCLTLDDGVPTAVYSAVRSNDGRSEVLLARGDRELRAWVQDSKAAVGMPDDESITAVRDPYLFEYDGRRYAVQGAGGPGGPPRVLLYDATDLTAWVELGDLIPLGDPVAAEVAPADIWECPNLFRLGDRWVLVVSLWRGDGESHTLSGVRYLVGDLAPDASGRPRFRPTSGGELDSGPCFYAPQVLTTPDRVLLWAWSWEHGRTPAEIERAGWAGALTWARELALDGADLVSRPVPELHTLRAEEQLLPTGADIGHRAFEIELPHDAGDAELWLVHPDGEELVGKWQVPGRVVQSPRILVDGSLVEVFPGRPQSHTTRGYPGPESRWRVTTSRAGSIRLWALGPE